MNLNVNKCGISDGLQDATDSVRMFLSVCICVCVCECVCLIQSYRLKEVPGGGPLRGGKGGGEPMAISGS